MWCARRLTFAHRLRLGQDGANNIKIADFGLSRMIAAADERRGLADAYLRAGKEAAEAAAASTARSVRNGGGGTGRQANDASKGRGTKGKEASVSAWDTGDSRGSGSGSRSSSGSGSSSGSSAPIGRGAMTGRTGTLKYMSPEVRVKRRENTELADGGGRARRRQQCLCNWEARSLLDGCVRFIHPASSDQQCTFPLCSQLAPQVFRLEAYDLKCDVFSFG